AIDGWTAAQRTLSSSGPLTNMRRGVALRTSTDVTVVDRAVVIFIQRPTPPLPAFPLTVDCCQPTVCAPPVPPACWRDWRMISAREWAPSLDKMCETWVCTVLRDKNSSAAMSGLDRPTATRRAILVSVGGRASRPRSTTPHPPAVVGARRPARHRPALRLVRRGLRRRGGGDGVADSQRHPRQPRPQQIPVLHVLGELRAQALRGHPRR